MKRVISLILCFILGISCILIYSEDTKLISTPEDFNEFASVVNSGQTTLNAILVADIVIKGILPVGAREAVAYNGTFDGNGHSIIYTQSLETDDPVGLFGYTSTAGVVKNLTVSGTLQGQNAGGVIGKNSGTVLNVTSRVSVSGSVLAAGIVCINNGKIINSYNQGRVTTEFGKNGGIAASNTGTIENCGNDGLVFGFENRAENQYSKAHTYATTTAGIAVDNAGSIRDTYNTAKITGGTRVAGIAGENSGVVDNCKNLGDIYAYNHTAGGIIAYNNKDVKNCSSVGDVYAKSIYAGGIIGNSANGTVTGCLNAGQISAAKYVGGIAGLSSAPIENCINKGYIHGEFKENNTQSESQAFGGIVGFSRSAVSNCVNYGEVYGGYVYTGGICGIASSSAVKITNAYNYGKVKGEYRVAGIVGDMASGSVAQRCANYAEVEGAIKGVGNYAGSIAARIDGEITNCFSPYAVRGQLTVGGIVGAVQPSGKVSNTFQLDKSYNLSGGSAYKISHAGSTINSYLPQNGQNGITKTPTEFADGTVAWLLNTNGTLAANSEVWSIDGNHPVFADENHKPAYKVTFTLPNGEQAIRYSLSNGTVDFPMEINAGNDAVVWTVSGGGNFTPNTVVDKDITVSGAYNNLKVTEKDVFLSKYKNSLALTSSNVSKTDKEGITAAIDAYNNLTDGDQARLTDKKNHLHSLLQKVNELEKTADTKNEEEFLAAIANDNIAEIHLSASIALSNPLEIKRSVKINGSNYNLHILQGGVSVEDATVEFSDICLSGAEGHSASAPLISCKEAKFKFTGLVKLRCAKTAVCSFESEDAIVSYTDAIDPLAAYSVMMPADENPGLPYDIYPIFKRPMVYFMLPSTVDLAKIVYYTISESGAKLERFETDFTAETSINLQLSTGECNVKAMQSTLPVLNINVDERYGSLENMNTSQKHTAFCYGDFRIDVPAALAAEKGWKTSYKSAENDKNTPGTMNMRGRGNSSWSTEPTKKRSYQIKSEKKVSLLDMGSAKKWLIVANDVNLFKNKLGLDLAKEIGMDYSLDSEFVDVYINGEYMGVYMLSEKAEVGKERVNISDLEDETESSGGVENIEDMTGGYLLEIDNAATTAESFKVQNTAISVNSPSGLNASVSAAAGNPYKYIVDYTTDFFNAVYNDGKLADGTHFMEIINIDSFVKYFWHQEFIKNTDCGRGSTNFYKDKDTINSLLYAGPVWDNDSAYFHWAPTGFLLPTSMNAVVSTTPSLYNRLLTHKEFMSYVIWYYEEANIREALLKAESLIAQYQSDLAVSGSMNSVRWDGGKTFDISLYLTNIKRRFDWIDENYQYLKSYATKGEYISVYEYPPTSKPIIEKIFSVYRSTTKIDTVNIFSSSCAEGVALTGVYKDGVLVSVRLTEVSKSDYDGNIAMIDVNLEIPAGSDEIRAFFFEDINLLIPLMDCFYDLIR